ncbi:MAG TPA: glycoside hydrolase family 2 TIM barrel-domain containing protein [Polyangiaceae bacterium]
MALRFSLAIGASLCVLYACGSNDSNTKGDDSGGGVAGAGGSSGYGASGGTGGSSTGGTSAGKAGSAGAGKGGASGSSSTGGTSPETGGASGAAGSGGAAGSATGGSGGGSCAGTPMAGIRVEGRELVVDCVPYEVRGVCWNPVPKGATHPAGLDYAGLSVTDVPLMRTAGINTVRTYERIEDMAVLDRLFDAGIRVLDTVYGYGGDAASVVTARVNAVKNHPAILGWVLGNEWNYNGLYTSLSHADSLARINEAAALVKAADDSHPVITVYGEVPTTATLGAMPDIDIWGINAYRGISFGDLFSTWEARSEKPMFLSEYGADAYNANLPGYDPMSQAEATAALVGELLAHSVTRHADGVVLGGTIFEWADEWWKAGNPNTQEAGGTAPGGGPYPDQTFNEEYWGVVDIDRMPRPAYDELKALYAP